MGNGPSHGDNAILGVSHTEAFQRVMDAWYDKAPPAAIERGSERYTAMMRTLGIPKTLAYQVHLYNDNDDSVLRSYDGIFCSPDKSMQISASDDEKLQHIINGPFETLATADGTVCTGIAVRDLDDRVFNENCPARIFLDHRFVDGGTRQITKRDGSTVEAGVLSTWFYDICYDVDSMLPIEMVFYSRVSRSTVVHRLYDIEYNQVRGAAFGDDGFRTYTVPVGYSVQFRKSSDAPMLEARAKVTYTTPDVPVNADVFQLHIGWRNGE